MLNRFNSDLHKIRITTYLFLHFSNIEMEQKMIFHFGISIIKCFHLCYNMFFFFVITWCPNFNVCVPLLQKLLNLLLVSAIIVIISQSISTGKTMKYVKFVKYLNLIEARYFSIFILVESSIPNLFLVIPSLDIYCLTNNGTK